LADFVPDKSTSSYSHQIKLSFNDEQMFLLTGWLVRNYEHTLCDLNTFSMIADIYENTKRFIAYCYVKEEEDTCANADADAKV